LATALEAVCLFILMRRKLRGLEGNRILKGAIQALGATLIMSLLLWGWLGVTNSQRVWLVGVGGVLLGGIVYGICMLLLRVPEAELVLNFVVQKLKPVYK
jgi:peptidoglycan biosynthesis protein MviN/MurJ (putative lipid II flippase)